MRDIPQHSLLAGKMPDPAPEIQSAIKQEANREKLEQGMRLIAEAGGFDHIESIITDLHLKLAIAKGLQEVRILQGEIRTWKDVLGIINSQKNRLDTLNQNKIE